MTVPATPADYRRWSAAEKAAWLWDTLITETAYPPTTRPPLSKAKPWTMLSIAGPPARLARTLDRRHDLMERNRPKIIHREGAVAMVDLEPTTDSPFTGVLAPPADGGGATGLVRISLAVPPTGRYAVTPGLGLKLLVDGGPSLDMLAMNHTVGQGKDFNVLSNTMTNDLRQEHTELRPPQKILRYFFARVTDEPRHLTIDHLAGVDRRGRDVPAPVAPYRLVFRAPAEAKALFRGRPPGEDYRDTLALAAPGSILYGVEAVGPPTEDGEPGPVRELGVVRLRTRFVCSLGGDRLFFRHAVDPASRLPASRPTPP